MSNVPNWALEAKKDIKSAPPLRFPPFPKPPVVSYPKTDPSLSTPGGADPASSSDLKPTEVTPIITPFASFTPREIQAHISSPSGEEIDTLGIPTIKIGTIHERDVPKTDASRRRVERERTESAHQASSPSAQAQEGFGHEQQESQFGVGYGQGYRGYGGGYRGRGRGRGNCTSGERGRGRGRGGYHVNNGGHSQTGGAGANAPPNSNPARNDRPQRPCFNHRVEWHVQWEDLDEKLYRLRKDEERIHASRPQRPNEDFPTIRNTLVSDDNRGSLTGDPDVDITPSSAPDGTQIASEQNVSTPPNTFAAHNPVSPLHLRSSLDRLHYAATDFRLSRSWPPIKSQVPYLWDQIRLFAGLLGSTPVWIRTDKIGNENQNDGKGEASAGAAQDDIDDSDQEDLPPPRIKPKLYSHRAAYNPTDPISDGDDDTVESSSDYDSDGARRLSSGRTKNTSQSVQPDQQQQQPYKRPLPRRPYALYGADPFLLSSDEEVRELLQRSKEARENRLITFLDDPEGRVRILLSSYMRREGLIWSQINLTSFPVLLAFFLRFVVMNKVFLESPPPSPSLTGSPTRTLHESFACALLIAEKGKSELPVTWKIPKLLPGKLGGWAKARWGVGGKWWEDSDPDREEKAESNDGREEASDEDSEELGSDAEANKNDDINEKEEENVNVPSIDDMRRWESGSAYTLSTAQTIPAVSPSISVCASENKKTGVQQDSYGRNPEPSTIDSTSISESTGASQTETQGQVETESEAQKREREALVAIWSIPVPVIPAAVEAVLTDKNQCGDVVRVRERSVRKVKSIQGSATANGQDETTHVRGVLQQHYSCIVLEPWAEWEWKEGDVPEVEAGGKVLVDGKPVDDGIILDYDPRGRDITLLVEGSVLDTSGLCVGMGLVGTFGRLELGKESNSDGVLDSAGINEEDQERKDGGEHYWYVEEIAMAVPSFWKDEGVVEEAVY